MSSRAKLLVALLLAVIGGAAAWFQLSRTLGPSLLRGDVPKAASFPPSLEVVATSKSELEIDLTKTGTAAGLAQFSARTATVSSDLIKDATESRELGEAFSQSVGAAIAATFEQREARLREMGFQATEDSSASGAAKWWKQMQDGFRTVQLFSLEGLEVREVAKGHKDLLSPALGDAVRTQGRPPGTNARLEKLLDEGASVIEVRLPASAPIAKESGRETVMVGYRFVRDREKGSWIQYHAVLYMSYNNQRVAGLPM